MILPTAINNASLVSKPLTGGVQVDPTSINSIAAAVWDKLKASHQNAGSFGQAMQQVQDAQETINQGVQKASLLVPHNTDLP